MTAKAIIISLSVKGAIARKLKNGGKFSAVLEESTLAICGCTKLLEKIELTDLFSAVSDALKSF